VTGKEGSLSHQGDPKDLPVCPRDEDQGYNLLAEAAHAGHKAAQYLVALHFRQQGDEDEYLKWLQQAASNNHDEAHVTYGCEFWLRGHSNHEKDPQQAIAWIRRALAHGGACEKRHPNGDMLTQNSFEKGMSIVVRTARDLYLHDKFMEYADGKTDDSVMDAMKLCADCGIVPAINIVAKANMKPLGALADPGSNENIPKHVLKAKPDIKRHLFAFTTEVTQELLRGGV
jgi:TPR repeat protein